MSMKTFALAAIGLSMIALGPAATLAVPEPAKADPVCEIVCDMARTSAQNRCHAALPPVPSMEDELEHQMCMNEAEISYLECYSACP